MRLPTKKNPSHKAGFSSLETLAFLAVLLGSGYLHYSQIKSLQNEQKMANFDHARSAIESAKNRFAQESEDSERKKFNTTGDQERFQMIAHLLTPSNSAEFAKTFGLSKIRTEDLQNTPTVE